MFGGGLSSGCLFSVIFGSLDLFTCLQASREARRSCLLVGVPVLCAALQGSLDRGRGRGIGFYSSPYFP